MADDHLAQRFGPHVLAAIVMRPPRNDRFERIEFRGQSSGRHVRPQARHDAVVDIPARGQLVGRERGGSEHVDRVRETHEIAELILTRVAVPGGQDADHRDRLSVEPDRPSDHVAVTAELSQPERMADDGDGIRPGRSSSGTKPRPSAGAMPKTSKKPAVTLAASSCSAPPAPVSVVAVASIAASFSHARQSAVQAAMCAALTGTDGYWPSKPGTKMRRTTSRSGDGYGSGFRRTALTTVNSAVLAPIPSARMASATNVSERSSQSRRAVRAVLRPLAIPPGDYMVPRPSSAHDMRSPEFTDKLKQGPVMLITVMPNGPVSMRNNLVLWFLYCVIVGLFAAYIAGRGLPPGTPYPRVFQMVGAAATRRVRTRALANVDLVSPRVEHDHKDIDRWIDLRAADRRNFRLAVAALGA